MRCLKKLLPVCLAMVLIVTMAPAALTSVAGAGLTPEGGNLITNGDFEDGLTGWKTGTASTEVLETGGVDGTKAVSVNQTAGGRQFYMENKIAIERNKLYELSVDVKLSADMVAKAAPISILDAASGLASDKIEHEYDQTRRIALDYTDNFTADEWTTLKGYYRYNGAAENFTTDFGVEIGTNGVYAIDNFSLVKVSEPDNLVIDYEQDNMPNPWVASGSNPNSVVERVSMEKYDGTTDNVLHFTRRNKDTGLSEYYLPVEVNPDGTDKKYMVSFYAKLDEHTAPSAVGLLPMLLSRGSGDYLTAYGPLKKITTDQWTKFEFTATKKSSFNFQIRPVREDEAGNLVNTVDAEARKLSYYISDLSIVEVGSPEDVNQNNVLKYGEFNNNETLSSWSFPNGSNREWISDSDGNGYVKITNAGITGSNAVNVIMQNVQPSADQYIKRDTWYRFSVKLKLENAEADSVDAQMFLFDTSEPKYVNDAWTDQSYYNTNSFRVNKADGWTEMVAYLRFSGIETSPATKDGYYTEGEPVQYLNNDNTKFAIRLYNSSGNSITNCDISMDDIIIEEAGTVANGDMEDTQAVRFNNNHAYGDAIKKGPGANNDSLTQGDAYTDMSNAAFSKEAAHSGEYGLYVQGTKASQTTGAAKQHVLLDASTDKYYKVSYWIKLKDPEAAKAAVQEINSENTDPKFYARLLAGYMSYYDRPVKDGEPVREIGDIGTMYPAANDITDGEWHNVSFVYNPSHYDKFVTATEGEAGSTVYDCTYKVPAASLAEANMEKIGFYLYPRISTTNFKTADGAEFKEGFFCDNADAGNGFDYYMDDFTIEEIPAGEFIVTSELKTEYTDNGNVKMEVGIANTLGQDQNMTILVAQYAGDNSLVSVKTVASETIYKDRKQYDNTDKFFAGAHNFEFEIPAEANAEYMKVFVWDGLENAVPLAEENIYFKN